MLVKKTLYVVNHCLRWGISSKSNFCFCNDFKYSSKGRKQPRLRVSFLKFEPKVSNFPNKSILIGYFYHYYYEKSLSGGAYSNLRLWCYIMTSFIVVRDGSSFALRISFLKFEPKVSNFPNKSILSGYFYHYYYEKSFGCGAYSACAFMMLYNDF